MSLEEQIREMPKIPMPKQPPKQPPKDDCGEGCKPGGCGKKGKCS